MKMLFPLFSGVLFLFGTFCNAGLARPVERAIPGISYGQLVDTTYLTDTICSGISYYVGNFTYSQTGVFQSVLTASDGTDSIVILDLTVLPPDQYYISATICSGKSYYVGNATYGSTGMYQTYLVAADGCDSVVNLDLTVLPPIQNSLTATICSGMAFFVGNANYSSTGFYQTVLVTPDGCDSIVDLDLTVLPPPETNLSPIICNGESYQVGNSNYTVSGNYQNVLVTPDGCDSIVNLNLTVLPAVQPVTLNESICEGQSYAVGDSNYTVSGTYQNMLMTMHGCDSLVTLNLTVLVPAQAGLDATICDGETYTVGAAVFSQSGQYQEVLTATNGCDSTVMLNLTVLPPNQQTIDATVCDGETYTVGATVFSQSGQYQEVLTAANGCDSTVTLNLTVLPPNQQTIDATICDGETYTVGATVFSQSGQYQEVLTAANGCDSTIALNLTVLPPNQQTIDATVCDGETYTVGSMVFSQSGQYQEILIDANGCDSTVMLSLTVLPPNQNTIDATICDGETYTIGATVFSQSGQYQEILVDANGCDSTVTLNLTVLPPNQNTIDATICDGETYTIGATVFSQSGQYQEVLTAADGCDSTVMLNLTVLPPNQQTIDATVCDGDTYTVGATVFSQSGQYQEVLTAANGCDSTVTLNLTVLPPNQQTIDATVCDGDTYTVGATVFSQSGQYQEILVDVNGCDSTVTLNLMVLPPFLQNIDATICAGESFMIGATAYSQSGQYQEILTTSNGCDSVIYLNLNVLPAFVPVAQVESPKCVGQTGQITIIVEGGKEPFQFALENGPFQDNETFSGLQPGVYDIEIQDSLGCPMTISATIEPAPVLTLDFPRPELTLISGDSILLTPAANFTVDSFFWQPAIDLDCPQCWEPLAYPVQSTAYLLTAFADGGCEVAASVHINVKLVRRVYVPNAFKPDSDGLNDTFTLYGDEHVVQILRMSIFDRWGDEIFTASDLTPNDPTTGWDGRYKGKDLSPGVFVYLFEVRFSDNSTELYSGDVTLVR